MEQLHFRFYLHGFTRPLNWYLVWYCSFCIKGSHIYCIINNCYQKFCALYKVFDLPMYRDNGRINNRPDNETCIFPDFIIFLFLSRLGAELFMFFIWYLYNLFCSYEQNICVNITNSHNKEDFVSRLLACKRFFFHTFISSRSSLRGLSLFQWLLEKHGSIQPRCVIDLIFKGNWPPPPILLNLRVFLIFCLKVWLDDKRLSIYHFLFLYWHN